MNCRASWSPTRRWRSAYDEGRGEVSLTPAVAGPALTTLTLTLSGSPGFCEAFREAFGVTD